MPTKIMTDKGEAYQFDNDVIVHVDYNVWATKHGNQIAGPSGADYYRSERGYNCQSDEEVAVIFYRNFIQ